MRYCMSRFPLSLSKVWAAVRDRPERRTVRQGRARAGMPGTGRRRGAAVNGSALTPPWHRLKFSVPSPPVHQHPAGGHTRAGAHFKSSPSLSPHRLSPSRQATLTPAARLSPCFLRCPLPPSFKTPLVPLSPLPLPRFPPPSPSSHAPDGCPQWHDDPSAPLNCGGPALGGRHCRNAHPVEHGWHYRVGARLRLARSGGYWHRPDRGVTLRRSLRPFPGVHPLCVVPTREQVLLQRQQHLPPQAGTRVGRGLVRADAGAAGLGRGALPSPVSDVAKVRADSVGRGAPLRAAVPHTPSIWSRLHCPTVGAGSGAGGRGRELGGGAAVRPARVDRWGREFNPAFLRKE